MLALLLLTAVLVAASFVLGQAVLAICGWREPRWWAPVVGYGVLLIWFGQTIHAPNHPRAMIAAIAVATVATLVFPLVRRSLLGLGLEALLVGAAMLLLAAVPFFAAGHTGILGASVSNDMSQHLTGAYWLRTEQGMLPVAAIGGDLIKTGYPLGPHSLAAALSRASGLGDERAFAAITLAVPVLTAFAALGLVPDARRAARWSFAVVIGLGYLPAAYLAQGSFKEMIQATLVFAEVVALVDLSREERLGWRIAAPIGVIVGAGIYNYSYGGLLWILGAAFFFLAVEVAWRRQLFSVARHWARPAVGAILLAAITIAPELDRIRRFRKSIFGQESLKNKGNLAHALNPLETLGTWFNGDFRYNPDPYWPTIVFCVIALLALAGGLAWWWRRRTLAVVAAVLSALFVWANLALTVNIYNAAKGLVVLAPLVMACIGVPLVMAWSARAATRRGRLGLRVARATGVVLLAGAAISSFAVLRSTPVGLGSHEQELAAMRPLVKGKAVLFLDNDHFAQWELRGANPLYTTNALYAPLHLGMHPEKFGGLPIDVDNYGGGELDKLDYIVVAGARYRSEIPPNFRLALRTLSYELYRREGPTPKRVPIEDPGQSGTIFDCASKKGKEYLGLYKWAGVLPRPVLSTDWRGTIAQPGQTARVTVELPRGRWDVSFQYLSQTPLTVRAPGLHRKLEANFGLITTFWPAGTLRSDGGSVTLSATAGQRSWFGRLLGSPQPMRAPLSPGAKPLFNIAFTRHGATPRRIPARSACGRYVDWFAPAGSTMRGR